MMVKLAGDKRKKFHWVTAAETFDSEFTGMTAFGSAALFALEYRRLFPNAEVNIV